MIYSSHGHPLLECAIQVDVLVLTFNSLALGYLAIGPGHREPVLWAPPASCPALSCCPSPWNGGREQMLENGQGS